MRTAVFIATVLAGLVLGVVSLLVASVAVTHSSEYRIADAGLIALLGCAAWIAGGVMVRVLPGAAVAPFGLASLLFALAGSANAGHLYWIPAAVALAVGGWDHLAARRAGRDRPAVAIATGVAVVCALGATLATGGLSEEQERVALERVPLAPGLETVSRSEDCIEGILGDPGSCRHVLAVGGPRASSSPELLEREIAYLRRRGWRISRNFAVNAHDPDCELGLDIVTARRELREVLTPGAVRAAYRVRARALERMVAQGRPALAIEFHPYAGNTCPG